MTDTLAPLPQVSIFSEFLDEEVYVIGQFATQITVAAETEIFAEGSMDRSLYVVIDGRLQAEIQSNDRPVVIGDIQAGDVFGEVGFLDGMARTATVRTLEPTVLLKLTRPQFDQLQDDYPGIAAKLMADLALVIALRLRSADRMIADLSAEAPLP